MTRYQHRPVANSIFSHVIIDTATGREIAWCTSERAADRAVRLRNEDEPRDVEPLCAEPQPASRFSQSGIAIARKSA